MPIKMNTRRRLGSVYDDMAEQQVQDVLKSTTIYPATPSSYPIQPQQYPDQQYPAQYPADQQYPVMEPPPATTIPTQPIVTPTQPIVTPTQPTPIQIQPVPVPNQPVPVQQLPVPVQQLPVPVQQTQIIPAQTPAKSGDALTNYLKNNKWWLIILVAVAYMALKGVSTVQEEEEEEPEPKPRKSPNRYREEIYGEED